MIYTSKASTKVTSGLLREIAESSAQRNAQIGVTGLLLYGSGNYFQLIEGGQTAVKSLCRRIDQDTRHHGMQMLLEAPIGSRIFPQWNMGQLNLDEPELTDEDCWADFNHAVELSGSGRRTSRDQAIAWIRQFIEHHGSETQKKSCLTGS